MFIQKTLTVLNDGLNEMTTNQHVKCRHSYLDSEKNNNCRTTERGIVALEFFH